MGRNPKQGLDYFPADVDMFQDRKIKRLLRAAGGKGFTVFIYLLTSIYRDKGYYYEWDDYSAFDISDDLNLTENVVEETVKACCSIGLFHEDLYAEESVLTSESIQSRWQKIVTDAGRVETCIESRLKIEDGKPVYRMTKNGNDTPDEPTETNQEESIYPFEDFWDEYDHKKERKKCERKWNRISETERETIKEFVPIYVAHTSNKKYRKYPSTFLNNEIWNDDWSEYPPKQQDNGNRKTKGDQHVEALKSL